MLDEGNDYEHAADDIERLLSSMAEEKVTEELEEELSEELQREANAIRYGNAHRNIHVTVNRMAHVDQNLIDSYNRVAPELLMLSSSAILFFLTEIRDEEQQLNTGFPIMLARYGACCEHARSMR